MIYHGVSDNFRWRPMATVSARPREYDLPERFLLFVGRLYA